MKMQNLAILIVSMDGGGGEREASILANYFVKKVPTHLVMLQNVVVYDLDKSIDIAVLDEKTNRKTGIMDILKIPFLAFKYKKYCQTNNIDTTLSFLTRTNLIACFSKLLGNTSRIVLSEVISLKSIYGTASIKDRIMMFLIKSLYKKADLIISNSKGTELELNEVFNLKKTTTIFNPIDNELIKTKSAEAVAVSPNPDKFSFISVARFQPQKDYENLIRAFALLNRDDWEFFILGEGENKEAMIQLSQELGVYDQIHFIGFTKNPFAYMAKMDCFVLSSFYEGFPNAMQEAMACGLPLISSNCKNGPREMIAPMVPLDEEIDKPGQFYKGTAGLLVPVADAPAMALALEFMMTSADSRVFFKKQVADNIKKYYLSTIIHQFEEALNTP